MSLKIGSNRMVIYFEGLRTEYSIRDWEHHCPLRKISHNDARLYRSYNCITSHSLNVLCRLVEDCKKAGESDLTLGYNVSVSDITYVDDILQD